MTGIERLRQMAEDFKNVKTAEHCTFIVNTWRGRYIDDAIADIADQIEREAQAPFSRVRVLAVISDMESRVSDEGGSFGALVARWAGELRGAVCSGERNPAKDVSVSAYDLLPADERDSIAWVREHGGLDHVRSQWGYLKGRANHADHVDRHLEKRQRQIDECHEALGRRNQRIEELGRTVEFFQLNNSNFRHLLADVAERLGFTRYGDDYEPEDLLDALDSRLMPEGCEWPRYESGELVNLGDRYECWCGKTNVVSSVSVRKGCSVLNASDEAHTFVVSDGPLTSHGKRVKRPAVPAADGKPLEAGQTVWHVVTGREYTVRSCTNGGAHLSRDGKPAGYCRAEYLTHQRPVLGADGVPIETCQKMWRVRNGEEVRVSQIDRGEHPIITYIGEDGLTHEITPDGLTHTKPEPPDSWERIEEDALLSANDYRERHGMEKRDGVTWPQQIREDLVRRCRALAERERGE